MKNTRLAIVNPDRCRPKQCRQECKKICPVVMMGKLCIEVTPESKLSQISEFLCSGCGQCEKRCPFNAITIVNLPTNLDTNKDTIHRYGQNGYKLHRLPIPRPGQVLGIVGANGTGKSTAIKILSGSIKPNFGIFNTNLADKDIINRFKGSELHNYLTELYNNKIVVSYKPQYVDQIPEKIKGNVWEILSKNDERNILDSLNKILEFDNIKDRNIQDLSGGELQRVCVALTCMKKAQVYIFDEPSSYLDISQRLKVGEVISGLTKHRSYVIVVEHDLSLLDYMSDFVCLLYGKPSAYGVVTMPFNVREGINILLDGYIPTENMKFRKDPLNFKMTVDDKICESKPLDILYPDMSKTFIGQSSFKLKIQKGYLRESEITVLLGKNGTGKTTFIKLLAGIDTPDDINDETHSFSQNGYQISYKPQKINPKYQGTVKELFYSKIKDSFNDPQFINDVIKPLDIDDLLDNKVQTLSGGELQRVAIILALGKKSHIYLIDEPSAYLDSEQRLNVCKVIKRFIMNSKNIALIVEHDFMMATYLADKVIVYQGTPGFECVAKSPSPLVEGMNVFLKDLDVTFRRDPVSYRPRINKLNSVKDREQKISGNYFYIE